MMQSFSFNWINVWSCILINQALTLTILSSYSKFKYCGDIYPIIKIRVCSKKARR